MSSAARKVSVAVVAALIVAAGPAEAQPDSSGYVSLRGARNKIKIPGASETITSYGVDGAVIFNNVGRYSIQLNGLIDRLDTDETIYDENGDPLVTLEESEVFAADAHLIWGRPQLHRIGAFASIFEYDALEIVNETVYGGGLEADFYSAQWTSSVQGGLFMGEEDVELYAGSGQARLHATPFLALEGAVAYGTSEDDGGDAYGVGAEAEFQFEGTPLSVFGGGKYTDVDELDVRTWMVGLRWNLGSRSLLERDRSGATMRGSQKIVELLVR